MEIDINQRPIAIGDKYEIFINGTKAKFARSKLFRFLPQVDLFALDGALLLTLKKRFTMFRTSFDIHFPTGVIAELRTIKLWRCVYQVQGRSHAYKILQHKGRRFSIFTRGIQIGYWDKQPVTWFEGDNYKLVLNDDAPVDLCIAICLAFDVFHSPSDGNSTVTYDFGNIGPEEQPFDDGWRPNKSLNLRSAQQAV